VSRRAKNTLFRRGAFTACHAELSSIIKANGKSLRIFFRGLFNRPGIKYNPAMGRKRKKILGKNHTSLAIDEWAVSRRIHFIIAMMAQIVVASAESMYTACRDARVNAKYGGNVEPPYPSDDHWMNFYNNPDKPLVTAMELVIPSKDWFTVLLGLDSQQIDALNEQFHRIQENSDNLSPQDSFSHLLMLSNNYANIIYRNHILKLRDAIAGIDDGSPEQIKAVKASPEILFMIRVWVPCFLEYKISFDELLTQARTGDIEAIEKIIRLDRGTASCDPLIQTHFLQAKRQNRKAWVERYTKALNADEPLGVFSSQHIKYLLAGYIYEMSDIFSKALDKCYRSIKLKFKRGCKPKSKLSYEDILSLFHCYAADSYPKNIKQLPIIKDVDFLSIDNKSFETRVRETRKIWHEILVSLIAEVNEEATKCQAESAVQ